MTTPEQWELGGKILDDGMSHPSMKAVTNAVAALEAVLADAKRRSAGLRRVGAGRTEDPTLILAQVVPALRELAEEAEAVAGQLERRLGGP